MDHAFSMIHLRKALSAVNQTKRDLRNVVHQETLQRKPPRRDVATRFTKLSEKVLRFLISSILFRLCLGTKQKSLSKLGRSIANINCTLAFFSLSSYSARNQFCRIFYLALHSL
ncbi:hypothetical protein AABB24_023151 [Solanum stoloniferum]|uniref:Uncharacterized protein n=1 Tax=Solanum stoloniferum TaxID=62892 RepID=A0ABD2T3G8_9SOLN